MQRFVSRFYRIFEEKSQGGCLVETSPKARKRAGLPGHAVLKYEPGRLIRVSNALVSSNR